jgi:hypothetical protein
VLLIFLPFTSLTAAFGETDDITISDLRVKTNANPLCDACTVSHTRFIVLNATNNNDAEQQFTMLIEIRDKNGSTLFLDFLVGTLNPNSSSEMGISWTVLYPGDYEVRSFAISNFTKPEILSLASEANVTLS